MNENLRYALLKARLQVTDVAAALAVDPKTVDRWLNGRIPYPRHRWALADLLDADEATLWPELAQRRDAFTGQLRATYPHRWVIPQTEWLRLFESAEREIDILGCSALFLAEDPAIIQALAERATAGVHVRILLADPGSVQTQARGLETGTDPAATAARISDALNRFGPLAEFSEAEIRLHNVVLYNSIYRADDDLMVTLHVYAISDAQSPVLRFTVRHHNGPATAYLTSFEHTWTTAQPYTPTS
ncbi:XRE family transcriptional regulator [Streptosporangiaceae bacterium NEAU-GS5]|nr:XRE family transcriptional regulator [Streptosporangiaceae bacterium NEAU-GS5]